MTIEFDNQGNIDTVKKMQRLIEDRLISTQELSYEVDEYNKLYVALVEARNALTNVLKAEYEIKKYIPEEYFVEEEIDETEDNQEDDATNGKSGASIWPWKK